MEYKKEYKSMNEIKIYIGSDNATNKITKEYQTKIENFFNQFIETKDINGYTLTKGIGHYINTKEDTIIITILTESDLIFKPLSDTLYRLKRILNQEAILITETPIIGVVI